MMRSVLSQISTYSSFQDIKRLVADLEVIDPLEPRVPGIVESLTEAFKSHVQVRQAFAFISIMPTSKRRTKKSVPFLS